MGESQHWTVKGRRTVFSGGPVREIAVEHVVLPEGAEIADYYRITLPDYTLVFAVTEENRVLVLRQYKHGVGRVCLGLPGGTVEEGEAPFAAAQRELREETGFVSTQWRALPGFVTNANQRCNVAHLFIAEGCRHVAKPSAPDLERPELLLIPRDDFWTHVALADIGQTAHLALMALATHPVALTT